MFVIDKSRVTLMGILNVTPDSFSDGGRFTDASSAIDHAETMMDEGANLIDVGGESTRPGSEPVPEDEELRRTIPIIEALVGKGIPVSIDTSKPGVAKRAIASGASVVNDVTGLRDPQMIEVVANSEASVCIMHMLGVPRNMQANPIYGDVVRDVREYLHHAASLAEQAGIASDRIWIDPGIGFGKTALDNLELLRRLDELVSLGYAVLVGVSRKSFIGRILGSGDTPRGVDERVFGSLAAQSFAQLMGAHILRVHDVGAARDSVAVLEAIRYREA